jgi:YggT family protein
MSIGLIIYRLVDFYVLLIFIYVLLSWFPHTGIVNDISRVLGSICEPYLSLFRKIIPPIGGSNGGFGIDVSPIVAILVLELVVRFIPV